MKTLFAATLVALMACTSMLGPAHAKSASPQAQRSDQAPQPHSGKKAKPSGKKWKAGGKYTGSGSQVTNYRRHGLKPPSNGHRWIREGNDFLLIAIKSGLIASVVSAR